MLDSYQREYWPEATVERVPYVDNGAVGRFVEIIQRLRKLQQQSDALRKQAMELAETIKATEAELSAMADALIREDDVFRIMADYVQRARDNRPPTPRQ